MSIVHGRRYTYVYYKCRCDACTGANTAYHNRLVDRLTSRPAEIPHGYSGYTNWRCRCEVCKAAGSETNRRQRERRRVRRRP